MDWCSFTFLESDMQVIIDIRKINHLISQHLSLS